MKEVNEMEMTYPEIVRNYKQAKNKEEQIEILADINCCTQAEIRKILINAGLEVKTAKRTKAAGNRKTTKIAHKKPLPHEEPIIEEDDCVEEIEEIIEEIPENLEFTHVPDYIREILEAELDKLDETIKRATERYKEIVEFLNR